MNYINWEKINGEIIFCKIAVVILLACMFFTFFTGSNSAILEIVEAAEKTPQLNMRDLGW